MGLDVYGFFLWVSGLDYGSYHEGLLKGFTWARWVYELRFRAFGLF